MITNVEHEVFLSDSNSIALDTYSGATTGELGCWIDAESTKMVQTGLEHSRIPDVSSYLEAGAKPLCIKKIIHPNVLLQIDRRSFRNLRCPVQKNHFKNCSEHYQLLQTKGALILIYSCQSC